VSVLQAGLGGDTLKTEIVHPGTQCDGGSIEGGIDSRNSTALLACLVSNHPVKVLPVRVVDWMSGRFP
jgi:hypothetical protein